jgi:nucleoside-diphosphate-sugar epimerase
MKVLILGIDGYLGWPLALHLIEQKHDVVGIDNMSRRYRVRNSLCDSLTPIQSLDNRVYYLHSIHPGFFFDYLTLGKGEICHLKTLLKHSKPDTIVHLAEQPSAPWSMRDIQQACVTQQENVIGTLELLWAMKECCPEAHLIKLGTMGEYGCYDKDTEILTYTGWKLFSELRSTDKVATRALNDRHLVFKVPNSIHEYDFDGELYSLQNNRLDLLVTPNHRMFTVKRSGSSYYGLREEIAGNIVGKPRAYDIGLEWEGESSSTISVLNKDIPTDLWVEFLGWYLSEGTVQKRDDRPNPNRSVIKQKTINSDRLRNVVSRISNILATSYSETYEGDISVFNIYGVDISKYLLDRFGRSKDKFIPQEIKQLSTIHLHLLLKTLLAGDGWKHHRGFRYYSISKRLADDVQEIALKCGAAATISSSNEGYTVNISMSVYAHVNHNSKISITNDSWTPYKGKVYCVNVGGDGIILVRRNGRPCWSGNTPNCIIPEGEIPDTCIDTMPFEASFLHRKCPMSGLQFPRTAGSFYHLSKVHDSANIEFCCRNWGMVSTDIMQGPVFGVSIESMYGDSNLFTRFDYDESFGTVINRFCVQAISNHPLTIYGKGEQTRGYLPLRDSMKCITLATENPPALGKYRVLNQFEITYTINELAAIVAKAAKDELGIEVQIEHYENPRKEKEDHYYNPVRQRLLDLGYQPTTDISQDVRKLLIDIYPFRDRVMLDKIVPCIRWDASYRRSKIV